MVQGAGQARVAVGGVAAAELVAAIAAKGHRDVLPGHARQGERGQVGIIGIGSPWRSTPSGRVARLAGGMTSWCRGMPRCRATA